VKCSWCSKPIRFWQRSAPYVAGPHHCDCWIERWDRFFDRFTLDDLSSHARAEAVLTMPPQHFERFAAKPEMSVAMSDPDEGPA
jgi:hypothetical protein